MTNTNPYEVEDTKTADLANNRKTAAVWYVWGRQDAGDYGVDSWQFADWYVQRVLAHHRGETSHLASIQDSYAAYKAGER